MRTSARREWCFAIAEVVFASVGGVSLAAQQIEPYGQTLYFGTGYINVPAAWASQRNGDVWFTISAKDIPSFSEGQSLASRLNTNFAIDTHWGNRFSVGFSLYSQNPEWGAFAQALLLRDGQFWSYLPAIAVGARNIGKYQQEDRFLIGLDVVFDSTGKYTREAAHNFVAFDTSPTLYVVATKDVAFSDDSDAGRSSMSFSIGYGNGLFTDDGAINVNNPTLVYNNSGTIAKGMFLGARFVMHPSLNTTLTVLAENDAWDWNAGVLFDWRGVRAGLYGTELEAGDRAGYREGINVYNYAKLNFSIGYAGNFRQIAGGTILRSSITQLEREQQRLRTEIVWRERRIDQLETDLVAARDGELARLERVRATLETELQAERDAVRRASERLRELEQGRPAPASRPPGPPRVKPPSTPEP